MPEGFAVIPASTVKVGTVLIADGGFECLTDQQECTVYADPAHPTELCVRCIEGDHNLEGQRGVDDPNTFVGFWLKA